MDAVLVVIVVVWSMVGVEGVIQLKAVLEKVYYGHHFLDKFAKVRVIIRLYQKAGTRGK